MLVYVPASHATTTRNVRPLSAIVGTEAAFGRVDAYLQDPNGFDGMDNFANRVHHAAGRLAEHYPTVARMMIPVDELVCVGSYDMESGEITLDPEHEPALKQWLQTDDLTGELSTSGIYRHDSRRSIKQMLASGDPMKMAAARLLSDEQRGFSI